MPRSLPPDPVLATVLRRLREERGLTQEALAFRAGLTMGALARIELVRASPSWVTVRELAKALEVSMGELGEATERAS